MVGVKGDGVVIRPKVRPYLLLVLMILPCAALAYPEETPKTLTFTAAKAFNRCVEETATPRLSAPSGAEPGTG